MYLWQKISSYRSSRIKKVGKMFWYMQNKLTKRTHYTGNSPQFPNKTPTTPPITFHTLYLTSIDTVNYSQMSISWGSMGGCHHWGLLVIMTPNGFPHGEYQKPAASHNLFHLKDKSYMYKCILNSNDN